MFMKRCSFLIFFCACISVSYAEQLLPFDTVALDEAIGQITTLGSDSPYQTVEEAGEALYNAFYDNLSGDKIDSFAITQKCYKEIVKNAKVCNNFINTYNDFLNHANFCLKANNITEAKWHNQTYSFQDCQLKTDSSYRSQLTNEITDPSDEYKSDSLTGQCKQWVEAAEQCQNYLIGYYSDKLNDTSISKSDKKKYSCMLEKVQTGKMDFPISKMEEACK